MEKENRMEPHPLAPPPQLQEPEAQEGGACLLQRGTAPGLCECSANPSGSCPFLLQFLKPRSREDSRAESTQFSHVLSGRGTETCTRQDAETTPRALLCDSPFFHIKPEKQK